MLDHVVVGASSLLKRGVEDGSSKASSWAWPVLSLEFLLFLPVLVFVSVHRPTQSRPTPKRNGPLFLLSRLTSAAS